jgi:hypothetical protein
MAGITLAQAEARLTAYLDAEEKLLTGHLSVKLGDKELRRADLSQIQEGIKLWEGRVARLSRTGGMRVAQVIPV